MANDIAKMGIVELRNTAVELKKKLAQMRFDKATGKLLDSSAPCKTKRELARVLTKESQLTKK
ncbi:MAG: 50S ribosomal protein L29 [Myxococcales bacterium]|nr:50S ribosomal protein L29 [Myxococcales bacterium]USN50898.1 MAG: 50S ribosomal protein L29 [Myxococcales bacterium]